MAALSFSCTYCGPDQPMGPIIEHDKSTASESRWRWWWKTYGPDYIIDIECPKCEAQHGLRDDGTPVQLGGSVEITNTSRPKIATINVTTGPSSGGTPVVVAGNFLDVDGLIVRFDGVAATNLWNITKADVTVVTPAGSGSVDITVENEFGQRADGSSTLVGAFTYT